MTLSLTWSEHHNRCRHRAYVLNCAEFDALYGAGTCHICGRDEMEVLAEHGNLLYIDHDGGAPNWRVRGLLCISCNSRLRAGERFSEAASAYLDNAYWTRLGALPDEPDPAAVVTVRWDRVLRFRAGRWEPTRYAKQDNRRTWSQWCDLYGPRLLAP